MYTTYKLRFMCEILFLLSNLSSEGTKELNTKFILQHVYYINNSNKINSYGFSMLELTDKINIGSVLDISVNSSLKQ